ncbi:MAG: hypothetical protein J3R72DRAFT_488039 [Linnemannia gamsii]|nr:MAG: hypothetical protein J3R72DRAFT_488039 [Linnemannia gamsii]
MTFGLTRSQLERRLVSCDRTRALPLMIPAHIDQVIGHMVMTRGERQDVIVNRFESQRIGEAIGSETWIVTGSKESFIKGAAKGSGGPPDPSNWNESGHYSLPAAEHAQTFTNQHPPAHPHTHPTTHAWLHTSDSAAAGLTARTRTDRATHSRRPTLHPTPTVLLISTAVSNRKRPQVAKADQSSTSKRPCRRGSRTILLEHPEAITEARLNHGYGEQEQGYGGDGEGADYQDYSSSYTGYVPDLGQHHIPRLQVQNPDDEDSSILSILTSHLQQESTPLGRNRVLANIHPKYPGVR